MLCGQSVLLFQAHFPCTASYRRKERLSGKQMTPGGATELMEVFGKEESIARIKKGIEKLSNN